MEFHQVLVSVSPGDAVTNAARATRALLRRVGPSEVFARYVHPDFEGDVFDLDDYARMDSARRGANVLLYHASIGDPHVLAFLLNRPERLVLVYHNISPAEHYRQVDPAFAERLAGGRADLEVLRDRVEVALAVSAFNARELEAAGFKDVRVSPLVADPTALSRVEPCAATLAHLDERLHGPLILFVGQLLPHKRPDLLVRAYHVLVTYLLPEAHLALAGAAPSARYRDILEAYHRELNLGQLWLPGRLSDAELAAYFRRASLFVTLSEHEGLCLPLLEAMSFDVPVVARSFAAVPETLGGAGLLLPPDDNPLLIAEALLAALTETELRTGLVHGGRSRLGAVTVDAAKATLLAHLADVA